MGTIPVEPEGVAGGCKTTWNPFHVNATAASNGLGFSRSVEMAQERTRCRICLRCYQASLCHPRHRVLRQGKQTNTRWTQIEAWMDDGCMIGCAVFLSMESSFARFIVYLPLFSTLAVLHLIFLLFDSVSFNLYFSTRLSSLPLRMLPHTHSFTEPSQTRSLISPLFLQLSTPNTKLMSSP